MSFNNYVQGDIGGSEYNVHVSGSHQGKTSTGLMIGGNDVNTYGFKITKEDAGNALFDLRDASDKQMKLRYVDPSSGTATSMLDLTKDDSLTDTTTYGAAVNGRVKASAYYVNTPDTRTPDSVGVYMGMDSSNIAYFNINKGTGDGGFAFNTYNTDGTLSFNNMNLNADGTINAPKYVSTGESSDFEDVAMMGLDADGNLVRNYAANSRFRAIEARATAVEGNLTGGVPDKVNEIIDRLNGLTFFSNNIEQLADFTPGGSGGGGGSGAPIGNAPGAVVGDATGTVYSSVPDGAIQFQENTTTDISSGIKIYVKNNGNAISNFSVLMTTVSGPGDVPSNVFVLPPGMTDNATYGAINAFNQITTFNSGSVVLINIPPYNKGSGIGYGQGLDFCISSLYSMTNYDIFGSPLFGTPFMQNGNPNGQGHSGLVAQSLLPNFSVYYKLY